MRWRRRVATRHGFSRQLTFAAVGVVLRLVACGFMLIRYLANLSTGRLILWCYFIWYFVVLVRYFDPSPRLWLTSLGLSGIIGFALYLSTTAGGTQVKLRFWPTFRLFLMPFCVSSFAALVKGKDFVLIFSPKPAEILTAVGLCALLCGVAYATRRWRSRPGNAPRLTSEAPISRG